MKESGWCLEQQDAGESGRWLELHQEAKDLIREILGGVSGLT